MGERIYDCAVIGAGVVGCAVTRALALAGLATVLLERGADILSGASKGNSAILHTGFDAPSGSLELELMRRGYAEYLAVREALGLPLLETGAMVLAWTPAERDRLGAILAQAHANGVTEAAAAPPEEIYRLEPRLAPGALGGVRVPGEHVIDPWSAPLAYLLQAIANGAEVRRRTEVTDGRRRDGLWHLQSPGCAILARTVVNAAGLRGDLVEAIARPSPFTIRPRKGQFVVYDKPAFELARHILLPVPTERTKGVLACRTAFGNLLVGPTAEDQDDRDRAALDADVLRGLIQAGERLLPGLAGMPVTATYAGLRPATEQKDYRIEVLPRESWISVGGIRSTGLTAALGIAAHVRDLYAEHIGPLRPLLDPVFVRVPNLAEPFGRPWALPGRAPIVCHCELVTRAEIEAALQGPLPAGDLGGLKRRTRAMMGRCQGFHCQAHVAGIIAGRLPAPSDGQTPP